MSMDEIKEQEKDVYGHRGLLLFNVSARTHDPGNRLDVHGIMYIGYVIICQITGKLYIFIYIN